MTLDQLAGWALKRARRFQAERLRSGHSNPPSDSRHTEHLWARELEARSVANKIQREARKNRTETP